MARPLHVVVLLVGCNASVVGANVPATDLTTTPDGFSSDLPCDVALILSKHCQSCHQGSGVGGAPMALVTSADLLATSKSDPSKTQAQRSLIRMQNSNSPMPPGKVLADADVSAFAAWVNAATPAGTCGSGMPTVPPTAEQAPLVCTSARYWTGGTRGSQSMEPGIACIACHQTTRGEAPTFTFAGTVYPTVREPDACNGLSSKGRDIAVLVTDSGGKQVSATPNSVGNFFLRTSLVFPIRAELHVDGVVTAMQGAVDTGDCNSCHTPDGANGAPGRIH